jgi:hypothetical protein
VSRLAEAATSLKAGLATALGTIFSGFTTFVGWIPDDIGKVVSLVGGILSIVLIQYWHTNRQKVIQDMKLSEVELKIKLHELNRLEQEASQRRRKDD